MQLKRIDVKPLLTLWWAWLRDRSRTQGLRVSRPRVLLVCFGISLSLWFLLTLGRTHEASVPARIRITDLPSNRALSVMPPDQVVLRVEGTGYALLSLLARTPDLPVSASSDEVDLLMAAPVLPAGIRMRNVQPRFVRISTEERITRRIPIEARTRIEVASMFDLAGTPRLTPDSITVSGARSIVQNLTSWPTETRTFENVRGTLSSELALADTLSGLVFRTQASTQFEVPVAPFTGAVRRVDVRVRGVPSNIRLVTLEPSTVEVRFRVLLSDFAAAMEAADFYATLSYDEIRADNSGQLRPRLVLPEGLLIRNAELFPPTVEYFLVVD